jgi:hypothetical protein
MASTAHPRQPAWRSDLRWIRVWSRAVVVPASRRADAVWLGCAVVGALIFGPTAMHPSDLTQLALHDPGTGVVLVVTWLLLFVPTARVIVRPQAAYLASLPGDPRAAWLVGALALIVLQLPWLALWVLGEGALGAAIVLATTLVVAGLARWQPPRLRPTFPAWRRPGPALRAIHRRALGRRAGDALVRGAGLAVLAGAAAGLMVRNNHATGEPAGVLAASVMAILLMPAQIGPALVTLAVHRDTAWLAAASGIPRGARITALTHAVIAVHLAATAIAIAAAMVIAGANPWFVPVALGTSLGTGLGEARAMLVHETSPTVAARVVIGAIVSAVIAVVCLAVLGASGAGASLAIGAAALLVAR